MSLSLNVCKLLLHDGVVGTDNFINVISETRLNSPPSSICFTNIIIFYQSITLDDTWRLGVNNLSPENYRCVDVIAFSNRYSNEFFR